MIDSKVRVKYSIGFRIKVKNLVSVINWSQSNCQWSMCLTIITYAMQGYSSILFYKR